jgi:hypothetical protein
MRAVRLWLNALDARRWDSPVRNAFTERPPRSVDVRAPRKDGHAEEPEKWIRLKNRLRSRRPVISKEAPHRTIGSPKILRAD